MCNTMLNGQIQVYVLIRGRGGGIEPNGDGPCMRLIQESWWFSLNLIWFRRSAITEYRLDADWLAGRSHSKSLLNADWNRNKQTTSSSKTAAWLTFFSLYCHQQESMQAIQSINLAINRSNVRKYTELHVLTHWGDNSQLSMSFQLRCTGAV